MGFYLRKSIRVGPLRFNLSKSGIGVSAGIPGFRVGTGPRGNYVHMGAGGLYYRSTIPSSSRRPAQPGLPTTFEQPTTHAPLEEIASGCVSRMVDSTSAGLLSELNQKYKRLRTWPFAFVLGAIATGSLVAVQAPPWLIVLVAVLSLVCVVGAYQFDLLSKTVVILYDFDSEMESGYEWVVNCMAQIARCGGKWHIDARGHVYDPKYHGGAGQLVRRKRISVANGQPPYVKTNIAAPVLRLGANSLYFFPERLLVFGHNGVGAISYDDLSIVINEKRFIEDESVPRDAHVVDQTWQYVNKSGGPDRRFSNNRQIPVCLYEELWLNSPSGLNEVVQLSRTGLGAQLDRALQSMADLVAKAAAMPPPALPSPQEPVEKEIVPPQRVVRTTREDTAPDSSATQTAGSDRVFSVLLDVLCCLMVADGRASSSEKKRIHELMTTVRSPWGDSELHDRIARECDHANGVVSLLVGSFFVAHDNVYKQGPYPHAEHLKEIKGTDAKKLLDELDDAVRNNDQGRASAAAQRYGEGGYPERAIFDRLLRFTVSEDGRLHGEKYYRTATEEFARARPAFRWRHVASLARVTASAYGLDPDDKPGHRAPGHEEACRLLGLSD